MWILPNVDPNVDPLDLTFREPKYWTEEEREHFDMGSKIHFVKSVRLVTKKGLKECVDYADRMINEHPELYGAMMGKERENQDIRSRIGPFGK